MEHEIPVKADHALACKEALCTKCGFMTSNLTEELWICDCIATRVEEVLKRSPRLRQWSDVMEKLARLYCLNETERQSGFEAGDEILEEGDGYTLLRDRQGLLLIVVHDELGHNMFAKEKEKTETFRQLTKELHV